jgi:hypothetical protein
MSLDYLAICPHCGLDHTIPYEDVRHHVFHIQGKESARKRKDLPEHMRMMQRLQKQTRSFGKNQKALLELAKTEDLNTLKLGEIADKAGIHGKYRVSQVLETLKKLSQRGLLSYKRRTEPFQVEQP